MPVKSAIATRRRAVSKDVPEPRTRSLGKPENFHVAYVKISTGFAATKKMPWKPDSTTGLTIVDKIRRFLFTRSRRVSPGF